MSEIASNEPTHLTEACPGCGATLRYPRLPDIKITCPKCGTSNIKNSTKKWRYCRHCDKHVEPRRHYLDAAGTAIFGVIASPVIPLARSLNKALEALGEQYCPKCDKKL